MSVEKVQIEELWPLLIVVTRTCGVIAIITSSALFISPGPSQK